MLSRDQADIVADAVMANGKERQRERASRREAEQQKERIRRRWAMGLLAVMLVGGLVAWLCGIRFSLGILMGGISGQLVMLAYNARRSSVSADS